MCAVIYRYFYVFMRVRVCVYVCVCVCVCVRDKLRRHWPDASDEMMNSLWPQECETLNRDGHAWALVQ
jgi:hypothetical protein